MARLPAPTPAASLPAPTPVEVPMAQEAAPVVAPVSEKASKLSAKGKSVAQKSADEPIKVRATGNGFFDCVRIRPGDVFELKSMEQFSKRWMELV